MSSAQQSTSADSARDLRAAFHAVLRGFGVLDVGRTPCGQPLHVSLAHGLMELLARPGLRQGELGAALGLSKSANSRLVDQMERRGWVERRVDERDARIWHVSLTSKGRRIAELVEASSLERFRAVLRRIPDGKQDVINDALCILSAAMLASRQEPSR